jgi:hypothetical protein
MNELCGQNVDPKQSVERVEGGICCSTFFLVVLVVVVMMMGVRHFCRHLLESSDGASAMRTERIALTAVNLMVKRDGCISYCSLLLRRGWE